MKMNKFQRVMYKNRFITLRDLSEETKFDIRSIHSLINVHKKTADKAIRELEKRKTYNELPMMGKLTTEQRRTLREFKRLGDKEEETLKRMKKNEQRN